MTMKIKFAIAAFVLLLASLSARAQCTTFTANVGFGVPAIGSTSAWGACLNTDINMLDILLGRVATLTMNSATPSVAGAANWLTNSTTPTTITNFSGGFPGQEIKIICGDTNTSISSNSTISVSGSFSCSASTGIVFVRSGTTWVEVGRASGGNILPTNNTFTGTNLFSNTVTLSGEGASGNVALKSASTDATLFVSTTGSDSNDGLSAGNAKLTGSGAESALPSGGGTVSFGAGTFTGAFTLSKSTKVQCNGNAGPTTLTIPNSANVAVVSIAASNSRVTGCVIDGNRANQTTAGAGVTISTGLTNVMVDGNTIQNTFADGVAIPQGSTNVTVAGNSFTNNNQSSASKYAVTYTEANAAIDSGLFVTENNFNEGTPENGCIGVIAPAGGAQVEQTEIYGNNCLPGGSVSYASDGIFIQGVGGSPDGVVSGTVIQNNVIFDLGPAGDLENGIHTSGDVDDIGASGNTISISANRCILINNIGTANNGENYQVSNNNCDATGSVEIQGAGDIKAAVTGNNFDLGNPDNAMLVDATTGTLHGITISSNTFTGGSSFPGERAIYLSTGVNDAVIVGNSIYTTSGSSQTQPAIVLTSSSNNLVADNNITGYTGTGNGAIGILISNSASTSNQMGVNSFGSVTTPYSDLGTGTLFTPQSIALTPGPSPICPNGPRGALTTAGCSLPILLYSAAGTPLPTCAVGINGESATVSDATSPTYMGAYTSGGGITTAVICSFNGSTYSWLTH